MSRIVKLDAALSPVGQMNLKLLPGLVFLAALSLFLYRRVERRAAIRWLFSKGVSRQSALSEIRSQLAKISAESGGLTFVAIETAEISFCGRLIQICRGSMHYMGLTTSRFPGSRCQKGIFVVVLKKEAYFYLQHDGIFSMCFSGDSHAVITIDPIKLRANQALAPVKLI